MVVRRLEWILAGQGGQGVNAEGVDPPVGLLSTTASEPVNIGFPPHGRIL